jgi:hypothetical protein
MKKYSIFLVLFLLVSCTNFGQLTLVADLSKSLKEVSGNQMIANSKLIWMVNDSGNKPQVFGVNQLGEIEEVVNVNAKNHDWEDLTSDALGNLYIGDFGNNNQKRKKLTILKIRNQDLLNSDAVEVEKISFEYPKNQKKKKVSYDAEAFFYYKNYFYIFTKSRAKKNLGKTLLFKVPNTKGKHVAELVSEFEFCNSIDCRITAADISVDGKSVVLLNHKAVFMLTNFKMDNFFSGDLKEMPLGHSSQKEGICFKDENTLLITDEYSMYTKGNLYNFSIKE